MSFHNHVIYHGGKPRGVVGPRRGPARIVVPQSGSGFLDTFKKLGKQAAQTALGHVKNEAKKSTMAVAQGLLEGKDLKTAVKDGSLQAVNNLKNQATQEVISRLNATAGHPDHTTQGRPKKRKRVQQMLQVGPAHPPPRKKTKRLRSKTTKRKKRKGQRGGNIFQDSSGWGMPNDDNTPYYGPLVVT